MAANESTKTCPHCAETIKAAAKICPCCNKSQGNFPAWLFPTGVPIIIAVLLPILAFASLAEFRSPLNPRPFSKHRHELVVVRTSLEAAPRSPESWLREHQTNQWSTHDLEIRFLDQQGHLVEKHSPLPARIRNEAPSLWLAGFITNSSRYSWYVSTLEIQFRDSQHNLVDVDEPFRFSGITLPPQSERAFRVELGGAPLSHTNLSLNVRVKNASDAISSD